MLDKVFEDWLKATFPNFSYVGNPSSKKYRLGGEIYGPKDLFTLIMDAFKPEEAEYRLKSKNPMSPLLWTSNSPEAKEAIQCLLGVARANKQKHANSERLRRQHDVSESVETTLSIVHDMPEEPSVVDEEIFSRFRQVIRGTTPLLYYAPPGGSLKALGVISKDSAGRAVLAKRMADCCGIDLKDAYERQQRHLSALYNDLQCLEPTEVQGYLEENGFDKWPELTKTLLVLLMIIGACAGSTGGGMKVSRFVIVFKTIQKEVDNIIHPRWIKKIQFDGASVAHETIRNTNVFIAIYFTIFLLSTLLVSVDNFDFTTNFTAVAATLNNIGPGLNLVGPTGNYSFFSPLTKCVLIFDMLAGRLEIFPMLLLLTPRSWKRYN